MEIDCGSGLDQNGPASQFQKASSIHHLCNHTCVVAYQFGNVYQCCSSGMLHVCDSTCASRVYRDRYSSICLISRKVHGPLEQQAQQVHNQQRKRGCCSQDGADTAKRFNGAGFAGSHEGVSMARC